MTFHFFIKIRFFLTFSCFLLINTQVIAEAWLTDSLYLDNHTDLIYTHTSKNDPESSLHSFWLLPELTLTQGIQSPFLPPSKLSLGSKIEFSTVNRTQKTQAILNEFHFTSSIGSHWGFRLGRQKISYAQPGLFNTSLNKNDISPNPLINNLTFSQGFLATYRLGYIEQQVFINQGTESTKNDFLAGAHYQLKVGVPGYKFGPIKLVISYEDVDINERILRGMLGSAIQFPMRILPGDWQWGFQYAQELNNTTTKKNQFAWQSSISWLGFIPRHKIGLLISHTDKQWNYSDNFNAGEDRIEMRYQWQRHQNFNIELAGASVRNTVYADFLKEEHLYLRTRFSF